MSREQEEQQKKLNKILGLYLDNAHILSEKKENLELEVKMGSVHKSITRINYENVIKKLKALGFKTNDGTYLLRIQTVHGEDGSGSTNNTVRTELEGIHNIRAYCQTNSISLERPDGSSISGISFIQKQQYVPSRGGESVRPLDYPDYDFRVSLMNEKTVDKDSALVHDFILDESRWKKTKKVFRYTNRHTFTHPDPDYPFIIDLSVIKSSRRQPNGGRGLVAEYTVQDAGVFKAIETYEIEIECIDKHIGIGTPYNTVEKLNAELKKMIKHILAGLQETNFPVSYPEQNDVKEKYMRLFLGEDYKGEIGKITPEDFAGPSSIALKIANIVKLAEEEDMTKEKKNQPLVPNITQGYTVTEKADGDRKLLFVDEKGKIYLLNTNLEVQFTGAMTKQSNLYNILLDGEHILHDKHGRFINRYAAFDLYFIRGLDVRELEFVKTRLTQHGEGEMYRLDFLQEIVDSLEAVSIMNKYAPSPLQIVKKEFYYSEGEGEDNIFSKCTLLLNRIKDGLFDYETDGLVFTPGFLGVGQNQDEMQKRKQTTNRPYNTTWKYSLKWKPIERTTIDFLVATKKNTAGSDEIKYMSAAGLDTSNTLQLNAYKTLLLMVGYDKTKHGNPYQDMINDVIPPSFWEEKGSSSREYVPVQFFPTDPYDQYAGICHIPLRNSSGDEALMLTEGNEVFEDNMIVEFRYDKDREQEWRWVPIKVRYDKTAKLRAGFKSFGNAYHVANDNWNALHDPVTEAMLENNENVPNKLSEDDDVYYNKTDSKSNTQALRNFHNLYVKNLLIKNVSKQGDTLIDLAVGKAGDLPKWTNAKLKFVFGVDISKDNILNKLNGACKRYLGFRQKNKTMPAALFVNGDSSKNIRTAEAFITEKDKQITKAVFGQGLKNENDLGKGVYKMYGVGTEGFDVCSIQFALHYMFKNAESLHNFLRNVSETTKLGGYFIGTSYDGKLMFDKLQNTPENESITIMENGDKLWEVKKKYAQGEFLDDATCLGYAIDVYQDSINKYFIEYLVNYDYLTRIIENYGFVLLKREEYMTLNLPASTGLFKDLFKAMEDEIYRDGRKEKDYGDARRMSAGERTISFLNRYFIYKKVRNVDALKEMERNLGIGLVKDTAPVVVEQVNVIVQEQAEAVVQEQTAVIVEKPAKKGKIGKKLVIR